MSENLLRIGTRRSQLALWQAEWVKSRLLQAHPGLVVELIPIVTTGDKILDVPLAKVGGKGLFVKEIEEAMLDGRADIAVHSMKDVPVTFPEGLTLGVYLPREDPRDALLSVHHGSLDALPRGARVGSSSLRRQSQLLGLRPDLDILSLRGNVNTRLRKLEEGEFDAIVLAAAGVKRLGLTQRVREIFSEERMVPAVGQGVVGVELRENDHRVRALLAPLDDPETRVRTRAERAFLAELSGGCQVPIAGHAVLEGGKLRFTGLVAEPDGSQAFLHRDVADASDAEALGRRVARHILDQGADAVLRRVLAQG